MKAVIPEPKQGHELRPPLEKLQGAHYALMEAYVDAVRRSSFLPGLLEVGARNREDRGEAFTLGAAGPIARALLAVHIRDRMKLLERVYVQLGQTIRPGQDDAYACWLGEAMAGCKTFGQSMSTAQAGLRALQVPGLSLVFVAILQQSQVPKEWILLLLVPLAYFLVVAVFGSFRLKRELLLHGARRLESEDQKQQERHSGVNAYRCEEELAQCLGYGRPREGQLDYLAVGAVGLVITVPSLVLLFTSPLSDSLIAPFGFIGVGLFGFAANRWRRRRWR